MNGVELSHVALNESHTIKLDKYGTYRVSFTAIDWNDKKEIDFGYIMEVADIASPIITITGTTGKTAKVGDKMNVAEATSKDELEGQLALTVFVLLPDGSFAKYGTVVTEYTMKGTYVFYLYSFDSSGNTAVETYEVTVD